MDGQPISRELENGFYSIYTEINSIKSMPIDSRCALNSRLVIYLVPATRNDIRHNHLYEKDLYPFLPSSQPLRIGLKLCRTRADIVQVGKWPWTGWGR